MGETLPLNIAQQLTSSLSPTQTSPTLSIPVNILSVPDGLQMIARPITVTGTIIDMLMTGEIALRSAMGQIDLTLTKIQHDAVKSLLDLLDTPTGKSPTIELQLQPGSPPKQATLVVPNPDFLKRADELKPLEQPEKAKVSLLSTKDAKQEVTIKVTVLPNDIDDKAIMLPKSEAQPTQTKALQDTVHHETAATHATSIVVEGKPTADTQSQQQIAGKAAPLLEVGKETRLRIDQKLSATAEWPTDLPDDQIKATVIGRSLNGQMLIKAEGKTLFVHDAKPLAEGTKLILTTQHHTEIGPLPLPLSPDRDFAPMRELAHALDAVNPQAAQTLLQSHLPTPQHHFAATSLFLLTAMFGGKFEEWMGPQALTALRWADKDKVKDKLVKIIEDTTGSLATDTRVGEWKAYPIPLHYAGAFEMLRLYVHRDAQQKEQPNSAIPQTVKTRFVISVNLSRLGPMQLDGLSQKKQLDLVVRSERELPGHLEIQLRETAMKSLEAVGLTGTILFQSGRQGWVRIEDNKMKPGTVVT